MKKIVAIQMTSGTEITANLATTAQLIQQAAAEGAALIVLPENFALMGKTETDKLLAREILGVGPIQDFLAQQAQQHKIWIVGGTVPLVSPDPQKVYNSCIVYDANGKQIACYHKIHLFDAQVKLDVEVYEESKTVAPGAQTVVIDTPVGRLGLAICYDLRFAELFHTLTNQGAQIIALPTAFTAKTGQAHWEVLTRARAIENFCYFVGSCQSGKHANDRETFGHSLIIDPWGSVLACLADGPGIVTAEIDLDHLKKIRASFGFVSDF